MKYTGTIVEESLLDNRVLNNFAVVSVRISLANNPEDRWHLYKVEIDENELQELSTQLKPQKWYMHFWHGDDVVALFPGKIFKFKHSDKTTWTEAIKYGKSIDIPEEQLDFVIE